MNIGSFHVLLLLTIFQFIFLGFIQRNYVKNKFQLNFKNGLIFAFLWKICLVLYFADMNYEVTTVPKITLEICAVYLPLLSFIQMVISSILFF